MSSPGRKAFAAGFVAGLVAGVVIAFAATPLGEDLFDQGPDASAEALEVIEESYWRDPDLQRLNDESVRAMVRALRKRHDDRFSHYFDPETYERFETATSGEFSGIGLTVSQVKRGLRVARVFDDTPAERADIEVGDVITRVDGRKIAGQAATASTAQIQGPPGTKVTLALVDAKTDKRREIELERARVRIPAVEAEVREVDGSKIGVVHLATFSRGAHGELRDEIERVYREGAEGLVLDLRGNGGGLLEEAVLTASIFVDEGVIVTTEGRTQPERTFRATGNALKARPTVVIVNNDTASAAEILAAALADHDLATVVGEPTFGKGTFQEVIELEGGGALDLTVGEFLTGEGESLADDGVEPDVEVKGDAANEKALRRGIRLLGRELSAGQ